MKANYFILIILIFIGLVCCQDPDKLNGTWISSTIDTTFTTWDISKNNIISNQFSLNKESAKIRIKGSRLLIDSGYIICDKYIFSNNETPKIKFRNDELSLIFEGYEKKENIALLKRNNLLLCERFFPELLLDIDLPIIDSIQKIEISKITVIYVGRPKKSFLNYYNNDYYIQLNDQLFNIKNRIFHEFISPEYYSDIVLFCDKETPMLIVDSLRIQLRNNPFRFGVINKDYQFEYSFTTKYNLCKFNQDPNEPSVPLEKMKCKHELYTENKWINNRIRILLSGNVLIEETEIKMEDFYSYFNNTIKQNKNDNIFFIVYDEKLKFENYIEVLIKLQQTFNDLKIKYLIYDINNKDLKIINNTACRQHGI